MAELTKAEIERVKFAYSLYDTDGLNKVDSIDLGDLLRGLNFNPSFQQIKDLGATNKKGEKTFAIEEILAICQQYKKDLNNFGTQLDFAEVFKMMDKFENGRVSLAEINGLLVTLGEPLLQTEMDSFLKDCMVEPDDDGNIEFMPFLQVLCARDYENLHIFKTQV